MTYSKLMTRFRELNGLNKSELARAVGVTPEYIGMVEKGAVSIPNKEMIDKICDALKLSKEQKHELLYAAVQEKIDPYVQEVIQEHYRQHLSDQGASGNYHGHTTAEAECPHCHKSISIGVRGKEIEVSGKISTKTRIK